MAKARKSKKVVSARKGLTVSHRKRLVDELRVDPELAAEYLSAAAKDGDPRVYLAACPKWAMKVLFKTDKVPLPQG